MTLEIMEPIDMGNEFDKVVRWVAYIRTVETDLITGVRGCGRTASEARRKAQMLIESGKGKIKE